MCRKELLGKKERIWDNAVWMEGMEWAVSIEVVI